MKKLKGFYNKDYSVISVYVMKTVLIIMTLGLIIYGLSKRASETYYIVSGILTPLILGLVLSYLFNPLTLFFENRVLRNIEKKKFRRTLAVALTFLLIVMGKF